MNLFGVCMFIFTSHFKRLTSLLRITMFGTQIQRTVYFVFRITRVLAMKMLIFTNHCKKSLKLVLPCIITQNVSNTRFSIR